jgi:hypothetical protein
MMMCLVSDLRTDNIISSDAVLSMVLSVTTGALGPCSKIDQVTCLIETGKG